MAVGERNKPFQRFRQPAGGLEAHQASHFSRDPVRMILVLGEKSVVVGHGFLERAGMKTLVCQFQVRIRR